MQKEMLDTEIKNILWGMVECLMYKPGMVNISIYSTIDTNSIFRTSKSVRMSSGPALVWRCPSSSQSVLPCTRRQMTRLPSLAPTRSTSRIIRPRRQSRLKNNLEGHVWLFSILSTLYHLDEISLIKYRKLLVRSGA